MTVALTKNLSRITAWVEQVILPELLVMKRVIRMAPFSALDPKWSLCSGTEAALARPGSDTGEAASSCSFYLPLLLPSSCTCQWGHDLTVYFWKYVENKLSVFFIAKLAACCNSLFSTKVKMGRLDDRLLYPSLKHSGNFIYSSKELTKGSCTNFVLGDTIFSFYLFKVQNVILIFFFAFYLLACRQFLLKIIGLIIPEISTGWSCIYWTFLETISDSDKHLDYATNKLGTPLYWKKVSQIIVIAFLCRFNHSPGCFSRQDLPKASNI